MFIIFNLKTNYKFKMFFNFDKISGFLSEAGNVY